MGTDIAVNGARADIPLALEEVLIGGDLSKLSSQDRVQYYNAVCRSLGLNNLTQPFSYITLNGKLTLYAKRDCTDQLRKINHVNITGLVRERLDDVYVVIASAETADGRRDESIGAVAIGTLKGEALANALMKAETKAKRRVTLSIVGLGFLDETETETIPSAQLARVNTETGEIAEPRQIPQAKQSVTFEAEFPSRTKGIPTAPPQPDKMPTQTGRTSARRPLTRAELEAGYEGLVQRAIPLGIEYKTLLPEWSEQKIRDEGLALRASINAKEMILEAATT